MRRWRMVWALVAVIPAMGQILPGGLGSRWWESPPMVEKLGLTAEQQKRMEDVFQQNRLKLIDLTAALDKEEAILEPLVSADQPDGEKIRTQAGRVADARATLEKANDNMLVGLRLVLSTEQWRSLQAEASAQLRPRKMVNGDGAFAGPPATRKFRPLPAPAGHAPVSSFWQVMVVPQNDAESVARSLRQQNFPVVLKGAPNQMTRVLVGPFPDAQSMEKARTDLESAGFHPVK